jgi:diadenosine tetraphosphate (Ap4A) HIT family hydrolase
LKDNRKAEDIFAGKELRRAIRDYRSAYPEPVIIKAGEELDIGQRNDHWSGWIWCTNRRGQSRWVPESYVERSGNKCIALRDYEATELSVKAGERLIIRQGESGWFWCTNQLGQSGWVPGEHLEKPSTGGCSCRHETDECIFCHMPKKRIVGENRLAFAIRDGFPVTPLHTLIIPKRHLPSCFDLDQQEVNACRDLLLQMRKAIMSLDVDVRGFNIGINQGVVAGQTVQHCHIHLIPRRTGDVAEPRGGIRRIFPDRGCYEPHAG